MLKCLCSAHRETIWPRPPMNTCRKEEIKAPSSWCWPTQTEYCSFYFVSSSPPSLCSIKEIGLQNWIRWLFGDTSLLAFQIRLLFLALALHLQIYCPSCSDQSELGLSNTNTSGPRPVSRGWLVERSSESMLPMVDPPPNPNNGGTEEECVALTLSFLSWEVGCSNFPETDCEVFPI